MKKKKYLSSNGGEDIMSLPAFKHKAVGSGIALEGKHLRFK